MVVLGKSRGQLICQNGSLITWGKRYGINSSDDRDNIVVNDISHNIINIVNQNNETFVLTEKGDVKQWPINEFDFNSQLSFDFSNQKIRSIAAGNDFIIMVSENEQVFSYGNNSSGQLGLKDTESRKVP